MYFRTFHKRLVIALGIIFLAACSDKNSRFLYNAYVANYGERGVLISQLASVNYLELNGHPFKIYNGIPGVRADIVGPIHFKSDNHSMPGGKLEVIWALADLRECERVYESSRSYSKEYPGAYVRKRSCQWGEKSELFSKTIDYDRIKNSPEYKRAGTRHSGLIPGYMDYYGLSIFFVFRDDEVDVHLSNFVTNAFR